MNDLDLSEIFPTGIPNENSLNQELHRILSQEFENVILNDKITGTVHIDLIVNSKIAIEVKKLESNTPKDELMGQLVEDLRIGDYTYGIGFGIDQTKNKKFKILNNTYYQNLGIYLIIKT